MREVEEGLAHYGVKGMRWGTRHNNTRDYNGKDYARDVNQYGSRGAKRIEAHVQGGRTIGKARSKEFRRQTGQVAAVAAVGLGLTVLPGLLKTGAASTLNRRQAKAADWENLQKLMDKTALTSYKTLVL